MSISAGCLDGCMSERQSPERVVRASREIAAPVSVIFELIADPSMQPVWDGNRNLAAAPVGQRIRARGDAFVMTTLKGSTRENHVVEFAEGRLVAWKPAEPNRTPPGHLWRWELEPLGEGRTLVTHTYDWTNLTDERRIPKAESTKAENLMASLDRLAKEAEHA
jgi:uncharacterized protein YndB with AHSA1/START domain